MGKQVKLFVSTRKGGFVFSSNPDRKNWSAGDIQFKSWNMMHMQLDPRDQRLHAAVNHFVYGPTTHYSDDFGETWTQARQVPAFSRPSRSGHPPANPEEMMKVMEGQKNVLDEPEKVAKVWHITPGRKDEKGVLYAGVEPAALFVSTDRGETWSLNEPLYDHPHRGKWNPGAGGLCLHTILPDPHNPKRLFVAISAGGFYRTDDSGKSWAPYNKNVRADFNPDPLPEYGQCVHKVAMHPSNPEVLFQQNHCGVYRSDNAGEDWIDIGEGKLPSRFGFPIVVDPNDARTIFVVLEESQEYHMSIDAHFAVWRSRDGGETWEKLTRGLPERAHLNVLRDAMATDPLDKAGIYIGTNTGQIFYSRDSGNTWDLLADYLPPVTSLEASVVTV